MARMPLVTLSAESFPVATCFAPLAESSKMLISLMKISCVFSINLIGASFGSSLTEMPMAGKRYVVSSSSLKIQPS